jgi:hypothetical protein
LVLLLLSSLLVAVAAVAGGDVVGGVGGSGNGGGGSGCRRAEASEVLRVHSLVGAWIGACGREAHLRAASLQVAKPSQNGRRWWFAGRRV